MNARQAASQAAYRAANRERRRLQERERYRAKHDLILEGRRAAYAKAPELYREKARAYASANREHIALLKAQRRAAHPPTDEQKARQRAWEAAYRAANRERIREDHRNRRLRLHFGDLPGDLMEVARLWRDLYLLATNRKTGEDR